MAGNNQTDVINILAQSEQFMLVNQLPGYTQMKIEVESVLNERRRGSLWQFLSTDTIRNIRTKCQKLIRDMANELLITMTEVLSNQIPAFGFLLLGKRALQPTEIRRGDVYQIQNVLENFDVQANPAIVGFKSLANAVENSMRDGRIWLRTDLSEQSMQFRRERRSKERDDTRMIEEVSPHLTLKTSKGASLAEGKGKKRKRKQIVVEENEDEIESVASAPLAIERTAAISTPLTTAASAPTAIERTVAPTLPSVDPILMVEQLVSSLLNEEDKNEGTFAEIPVDLASSTSTDVNEPPRIQVDAKPKIKRKKADKTIKTIYARLEATLKRMKEAFTFDDGNEEEAEEME